jgi:predicted small lipoprotein YifL
MTKTILLTAAAVLAVATLAGCDRSDKGPKSMEQAKEEAAKLERPKPGLYKQSMTITKFEIPGAPPEMAAQIQAAMTKAQESNFCMTAEMANQGFRDMFDKVGKDGECKYERFDVSGGALDALLHCENATQGKGTITMTGKVGEEGSDVNVAVEQVGGQAPMANAKIAMHLVSQRIGECTGSEKVLGK